jgi:hypothetical protein
VPRGLGVALAGEAADFLATAGGLLGLCWPSVPGDGADRSSMTSER